MVGKICTVCKQSSVSNKYLSFFTYPADSERRYEWLKAVDRLDLLDKLVDNKSRGNHRICEAHFWDSFIKKSKGTANSRKCLTKDAFPCIEHVNQALLNYEKVSHVDNKHSYSTRKNSMLSKKKLRKEDETDNFVNVPMESDTAALSSEECANNDPHSDMDVPTDEIKCGQVNDVGHTSHCTSPELTGFPDMSEFCESVIKVCKETQTPPAEDVKQMRKRKLDAVETNEHFIQTCSKNLPKGMVQLIKWQMNSKENVGNYKFHMFALNLYFSGANSYNLLKDMMGLPDLNTLKRLIVPKTTKFDNSLINALKIKVDNMSDRERICSLSVSSEPLKPCLYYNITRDKVEGFHEIDGVQKVDPAKYALVFMAQGILEKWTQPIAYAFISHHDNSPDISIWVEEIITLLIDIGLNVKAFVSDPKTEKLYMLESQRVSCGKPYFSINNKNIYYIYDIGKLRKMVENCLKTCCCILYTQGPTSDSDDNDPFRSKLRNLSNILNTRTHRFKRAYSNWKYLNRFLENMLYMFQNLRIIRRSDGKDVAKTMKFIDSFQISIISIMKLNDELNKTAGAKTLITSRLSQNSLNKFFAKTKRKGKKSSARQFKQYFSRCFIHSMLKKPIGDCKRNEPRGFNSQSLLHVGKSVNQAIKVATTDYRLALPDKKRFDTVCRYLYLKCIDNHTCNTFQEYLSRSPESRQYVAPYRSSAPLDIRNCKLIPPQNFTDFIQILEKRFRDYCRMDIKINSIGHQFLKKISSFEFGTPCQCFPLDYVKKLFVRLRIFYAVRENNVMYKKDASKLFKSFNL